MNYSRQRELIQKTIRSHPVHPTADELLTLVRAEAPAVSLATVYRNLKQLADEGEVQRISVPGEAERFDGNPAKHHHLFCSKCFRVYDIATSEEPDVSKIVASCRHQITGCSVLFSGICESCLKSVDK